MILKIKCTSTKSGQTMARVAEPKDIYELHTLPIWIYLCRPAEESVSLVRQLSGHLLGKSK